jgi:hypothetical protein
MKILPKFKKPLWLAFYIAIGLMAVGYLGIRMCGYLDARFPMPMQHGDWTFFGYFDGPAALCYMLVLSGALIGAISFLVLLAATCMKWIWPSASIWTNTTG